MLYVKWRRRSKNKGAKGGMKYIKQGEMIEKCVN